MIRAAIMALAEGGGSTAAAIDRHIRSAHRDLPWGHCNLLPYYLRKLAAAGEIARTHSGRYCLDDDDDPCCADAAAAAPTAGTLPPPPPRKLSEGENGKPSRSDSPTGQPGELGGDDGGSANMDLLDENVPLAMLLPGRQKRELPHLSIRLLKRKIRERNASFSTPSIGDPVGSPVARRTRRPPKPKAAVVLGDDRKEEGSAGHEGRESEAKLLGTSFPGDPTGSPVVHRRGRPPKRKDAIILKDDRHEAGSRYERWQSEPKLSSPSSIGDPESFPVIKRRGRPPKRKDVIILKDVQHEAGSRDERSQSEPKLSSLSSNGGDPDSFPPIKRRGRPPKRGSAMIFQVEQREADAGRQDRQCERMPISGGSSTEDPVSSPVIKRRGRPPKLKAAMTLPDDDHPKAAAGQEDPQPELKLVTVSSMEDPTSSAVSAPVKRRERPPKHKAAKTLPDRDHHEATAGQEDAQPEFKLVAFSSIGDPTGSAASAPVKGRGRPPKPKAEACHEPEHPEENSMTQSCKEGTEFVLPGHGRTREEAGVGRPDAIVASEGELRLSTRCGLARVAGDDGLRRVTRSVSAKGWPRPSATVVGQVAGNEMSGSGSNRGEE